MHDLLRDRIDAYTAATEAVLNREIDCLSRFSKATGDLLGILDGDQIVLFRGKAYTKDPDGELRVCPEVLNLDD